MRHSGLESRILTGRQSEKMEIQNVVLCLGLALVAKLVFIAYAKQITGRLQKNLKVRHEKIQGLLMFKRQFSYLKGWSVQIL